MRNAVNQIGPPRLTIRLWVWLALHVLLIAGAALRVPLWARAPQASELFALPMMAIGQIFFSSLLFPWLLQSWRAATAAIATAVVFIFLAGLLAPEPMSAVVGLAVFLVGWLTLLAAFAPPFSSTGLQMTAIAAVSLFAVWGPASLFLQMEYGTGVPPQDVVSRVCRGPISAALGLISGQMAGAAGVLLATFLAGIALFFAKSFQELFFRKRAGAAH